ncbi:ParB/RepB/Spo0J family partition protein, partial [Brevibacterium sediminis]|uniref:ParB N-terminal domain-containing protein n=1 Tax=Brevibacterium sediminis TaxID=1857024 RepID=UPI003B3B9637
MDALDETRPAAASESEPSTASESDNGTSRSASIGQPGDSDTVETADEGELDDFEGVESIPDTEFGEIDVDLIDANPRQPRTVFDEDLLAELVHSIREIGVLQPVVVRQKPSDRSRFELIMGERRLRATKDAGLSTIPAIIRYVEDT